MMSHSKATDTVGITSIKAMIRKTINPRGWETREGLMRRVTRRYARRR